MKFLQALKEAVSSISSNRTRTFLTILGIVIGVGAVISLMAIGQGAQQTITGQIESIGTNVIYVMKGNMTEDVTNPRDLTLLDVKALENRNRAPNIEAVSPVLNANSAVKYGGESESANIIGSNTAYQKIMNLEIAEGAFFTDTEVTSGASVVVIGPELAQRLLGRNTNVVGTSLRINGQPFRVVGVTVAKGGSQFNNPDLNVYMPITSMQLRVRRGDSANQVQFIIVQARSSESMDAAISETSAVMRASHRLNPRQPNDFTITNQDDFLSIASAITSVLTIFLSGIAAISLLVGGIGIMNIMLVSVSERTQEIGLRKALGARKADIKLQFLTESAMLSLIGGLLGIGLGWLLSSVVGTIAARSGTPLVPAIGLGSVLLATLFSTAIGIFFGLYPASRAASLEPVEALRHE
ncbi:MAG TPA: ABC transporter permease [Anaerolineaceae bacterium]|jgi:putative ABC transport system permease protein|nr:ABC transporter permease [Anaerolineaceae bacterium]HPS33530.1 ABC transporter permease [Anaerolineaceae bacterium]